MAAFSQGVLAGERAASGWIDAYETADTKRREKLAEEEIAKVATTGLVPDYRAVPAGEPTRTANFAPQGGGLGTGTYDPDVASVPGMRSSVMGLQDRAPQAAPRSTSYNVPMSDRVGQEAAIYAKYGLTKQAAEARNRAYTVGREEKADRRQEKLDANNEEERGIRVGELKRQVTENEGNRSAIQALSVELADGKNPGVTDIYKYAQQFKGDPKVLTAFMADALKIDESVAKAQVEKLSREVTAASVTPEKLNKYLLSNASFDPNPDDQIKPEVRKVGNGWGMFYGKDLLPGTQLYADTKTVPGYTAMIQDMLGKLKGKPLEWAIQKLAMDKDVAAIDASRASVTASNASAAASGANVGLTNARAAQVGAQTKILDANLANNEEARKILTQMAALDFDADPAAAQKLAGLQAQFNVANAPPGKTIPVGGGGGKTNILKQPVEQKINNDGTYTAFSKDGGQALYNTFNGLPIPLGMTLQTFEEMKKLAVQNGVTLEAGEDGGVLKLKYAGKDGQFYDDPVKAKRAKAPAPEKETPAAPAKNGIDTSKASTAKVSTDEAPPVKERIQLGKKRYTIEGLPRVYDSEAEAKKAWATAQAAKNKNKLSFSDD